MGSAISPIIFMKNEPNDYVFLSYNQMDLDSQYGKYSDPSAAKVAISSWAERSKDARFELDSQCDVRYGSSDSETLDIFKSNRAKLSPINIFFHGGYWKSLHKNEFSYVAYGLHQDGGITVVVNYALVTEVSLDILVEQCRTAVSWIWINAESFGGDRENLFVSGHSAGGHLVAMMMATDWPTFHPEMPAQPIRGGFGISGLYDLQPIRLSFLNEDLKLNAESAKRNSPSALERKCLAPLVLAVGQKEGEEFHRQTNCLADAWKHIGNKPELLVMPDQDHFSIATQLGDSKSNLSRKMHEQMGL